MIAGGPLARVLRRDLKREGKRQGRTHRLPFPTSIITWLYYPDHVDEIEICPGGVSRKHLEISAVDLALRPAFMKEEVQGHRGDARGVPELDRPGCSTQYLT